MINPVWRSLVSYFKVLAAAMTMYQRARKLSSLAGDLAEFHTLADLQMESYLVSINALSLVDSKNAWFVMPASDWGEREVSACSSTY